jgi:hypothetical protein
MALGRFCCLEIRQGISPRTCFFLVFSFVYILKVDSSYQAFGTEALVLKWFGRPQTCCAQEARVQSRPASLHKATKSIRLRHRLAGPGSGGTGEGGERGAQCATTPASVAAPGNSNIRPTFSASGKVYIEDRVALRVSIAFQHEDLSSNAPLLASTLLRTSSSNFCVDSPIYRYQLCAALLAKCRRILVHINPMGASNLSTTSAQESF